MVYSSDPDLLPSFYPLYFCCISFPEGTRAAPSNKEMAPPLISMSWLRFLFVKKYILRDLNWRSLFNILFDFWLSSKTAFSQNYLKASLWVNTFPVFVAHFMPYRPAAGGLTAHLLTGILSRTKLTYSKMSLRKECIRTLWISFIMCSISSFQNTLPWKLYSIEVLGIYMKYLCKKELLNMNLNLPVDRIFFSVTFGFSFHYMT